jgi:hypothetical protein
VLEVLGKLVCVAPAANCDSQSEEGQNIRPEELPHCNVDLGIALNHQIRALNLRRTDSRDGRYVVHGVFSSSSNAAEAPQV